MKSFDFQKFSVCQSPEVFRVGTDGVLLGALSSAEKACHILEVGCGTGLISLMLAQRNPVAEIQALDINPKAIELSELNFKNSPFSARLSVECVDFKKFTYDVKFDLIVCNPPYFGENSSIKDVIARQKIELDFFDLVKNSSKFISENGIFSVIVPAYSAEEFCKISAEQQLFLIRKINIYGISGGSLKRNILEFSPSEKPLEISDFTIEKSPRKYSNQYLELTKEFHVFRK